MVLLVVIEASKEGVKFSCSGDIGNGSVTIRQHTNVEKPEQNVAIALSEPVALTFSLKYLTNFCKASNLSSSVTLHLSQEVPLLVEYNLGSGHLRFYLAPKVCRCRSWQDRTTLMTLCRLVTRTKHGMVMTKNDAPTIMEKIEETMNVISAMFPANRRDGNFSMFSLRSHLERSSKA